MDLQTSQQVFQLLQMTVGEPLHFMAKGKDWVGCARLSRPEALASWVKRLGGGVNVYVCPNPCRAGRVKPAKSDITAVRWLCLDFDPLPVSKDYRLDPLPHTHRTLQVLADPHDTTVEVWTGRGYQLWIRMEEQTTNLEELDLVVKGTTRWLATQLGGVLPEWHLDMACAEISRVIRVPGTTNQKTGTEACFLYRPTLPRPLPWSALRPLAVRGAESSSPVSTPASGKLLHVAPLLNPTGRHFLAFGTDSSVDSRHKACYATARGLHEVGVSKEDAWELLGAGAALCRPPLSVTDWRRIHRQVYR